MLNVALNKNVTSNYGSDPRYGGPPSRITDGAKTNEVLINATQ